ncbi:TIGR02449 family protein [Agaribacterium sp. ZY112]|uniref:TIGR02449 family protein n=1 Tax=Agaribacterium sp. ZY112 TaxID=3233574 RepID=UPI00352592F6
MTPPVLAELEQNIDALIKRCAQLEAEAKAFREKESAWQQEREQLIEKNQQARIRVEAMITHLKGLSNTEQVAL